MNFYSVISGAYDLLDVLYFSEKGKNPRKVIQDMIPNKNVRVLDLCCGTFSNGISIARSNPNNKVVGIDLNRDMLLEARRKVDKEGLKNVCLKKRDATNTRIPSHTFDYVVIGLCLHECAPELREKIIKEAYRLLKKDGRLVILEWEREDSLVRRVKYIPLYIGEIFACKNFPEFYRCDKKKYFESQGFKLAKYEHCNYTCVLLFKPKSATSRYIEIRKNKIITKNKLKKELPDKD